MNVRRLILFPIANLVVALLLSAGVTASSSADPVFKSVNRQGAVSYGDKPAAGATSVQQVLIEDGPSAQRILDARAVSGKIRRSADQMEAKRLANEAVAAKEQRARDLEAQFQAELEADIKQAEATAAAQRQAQEERRKQQRKRPPGARSKPTGPLTNSDKAINMRPNVPLLNLPGPAE